MHEPNECQFRGTYKLITRARDAGCRNMNLKDRVLLQI